MIFDRDTGASLGVDGGSPWPDDEHLAITSFETILGPNWSLMTVSAADEDSAYSHMFLLGPRRDMPLSAAAPGSGPKSFGALLVAGIVVATVVLTDSAGFSIVDEDCPDTVRYGIAVNAPSAVVRRDDIALVDRDGRVTRLTRDHSSFDPSFSPDGTRVAFTRGFGGWSDGLGFVRQRIVTSDVDGANERKLTDGHFDSDPAWSPDGDVIVFVRNIVDDGTGLMVAPVNGGQPRIVYQSDDDPADPQWSADGDRIAFTAGPEASIYVINEDGSGLRRIASHLGDVDELTWSPDGETFAYDGGEGIFTVTLEERNPRLWKSGYGFEFGSPEFSPDGTQLLYRDLSSRANYIVAPLEGGTPEPLAQHSIPAGFELSVDWLDCS